MQIYNAYLRQSTSVCVSGDKNVRFSENLACSVFLKHRF